MRPRQRRASVSFAVLLLTLTGLLSACAVHKEAKHTVEEPMTIEEIEGTELKRITLTQSGFDRLAIRTVTVQRSKQGLTVTSDAVLVDVNGLFWVYVRPEPLVFHRQEVKLDRYVGTRALLASGPPAGTEVVLEGAAELYGAEFGIK